MSLREYCGLLEGENCPGCGYGTINGGVCDNPSCGYGKNFIPQMGIEKSVNNILGTEKTVVTDYLKNREFLFFPNLSNISENEFLIEGEIKGQKFSIKGTYSIRIINDFHSSEQEERSEKKNINNIIITENNSLDQVLAAEIVFRILDDYKLNKYKI